MKKILALILALCMAASLCACGGSGSRKDIDPEALAQALLDSGAFTDLLSRPADGVAARLYGYAEEDVASAILYTGTGATAEEILILKAHDAAGADAVKTLCETRVSNQKLAFQNYAPDEVTKLDSAIIAVSGSTVIFVVPADAAAAQAVVDSYT